MLVSMLKPAGTIGSITTREETARRELTVPVIHAGVRF